MNETASPWNDEESTFVINLDRSIERMRLFEREAERVGLPYARISAVDGRTIDRSDHRLYDRATTLKAYGGDLTGGELGCYLSHIHIWQMTGPQWCLVLEDDARIDARLADVLANVHRLPADWEIVLLQSQSAKIPISRAGLVPGIDVVRYLHIGYFASGYLIHQRARERLRNHLLPVRWPIDHWDTWWSMHGLVVYRTDADLVTQDASMESTMRRNPEPAVVPALCTAQCVPGRRIWRTKAKLLRLYRVLRAVAGSASRGVASVRGSRG